METMSTPNAATDVQKESSRDINGHVNGDAKRGIPPPPKRRLAQIYALPLPITCRPIPAFIPHNPLSIVRVLYAILSDYNKPYSSHPAVRYRGIHSPKTQSVHVTDPDFIRALWEKGFFGKGTLSRSDPSWLSREKRRRGEAMQQSSEEYTQSRRDERQQMKFERALKERETIENQLREEGKLLDLSGPTVKVSGHHENGSIHDAPTPNGPTLQNDQTRSIESTAVPKSKIHPDKPVELPSSGEATLSNATFEDQEHLQLSPEEAFFLSFGLGVLEVYDESSHTPLSTATLFQELRISSYPPDARPLNLKPDDPFLLKYVVYHHFRSLGWVLRGGSKFSVDYLLYNRGPVFSHAEYAVLVLPSYSDPYWTDPSRQADVKTSEERVWHWLHCISRVQAHVHKTLVLAYVDVPPPKFDSLETEDINIGKLLKLYKVREFVVRRWLFNRSRD